VKLKIIDALLTLILMMRQGACHCWYSQWRLPISDKCMSATNRNINYPRCEAKNRWCTVDAHSQNGAVTLLLSFLPIKAANTSLMHNSNQITVYLLYLQNHKSLKHCWRSFQCFVHSTSAAIDNSFHHDLNLMVVYLTDWDMALWQSQAQ